MKETKNENVEKKEEQDKELLSEDVYLTSGVHIGTRQKTADMKTFIYKVRNDGLYIIDVKQTDEKIKVAAKLLAKYDPSKILAVSVRQYGQKPVREFARHMNMVALAGRFTPGLLTNPSSKNFMEPEIIFLTDPLVDIQALHEARNIGIPVIGLCDTNNETKYVDLVIPTNNKGRRSLALIYWLLTRETLKERGKIQSYEEFTPTVEDFEAEI